MTEVFRCPKCRQDKPANSFGQHWRGGRMKCCTDCIAKQRAKRREERTPRVRHDLPPDAPLLPCSACGEWKPRDEFNVQKNRPRGRQSRCKPCYQQREREWTKERPDLYYARMARARAKFPKAVAARTKVTIALGAGGLKRGPCEVCGKNRTHGHHDDYDHPLRVRWLCVQHHKDWHMANGHGANIE